MCTTHLSITHLSHLFPMSSVWIFQRSVCLHTDKMVICGMIGQNNVDKHFCDSTCDIFALVLVSV